MDHDEITAEILGEISRKGFRFGNVPRDRGDLQDGNFHFNSSLTTVEGSASFRKFTLPEDLLPPPEPPYNPVCVGNNIQSPVATGFPFHVFSFNSPMSVVSFSTDPVFPIDMSFAAGNLFVQVRKNTLSGLFNEPFVGAYGNRLLPNSSYTLTVNGTGSNGGELLEYETTFMTKPAEINSYRGTVMYESWEMSEEGTDQTIQGTEAINLSPSGSSYSSSLGFTHLNVQHFPSGSCAYNKDSSRLSDIEEAVLDGKRLNVACFVKIPSGSASVKRTIVSWGDSSVLHDGVGSIFSLKIFNNKVCVIWRNGEFYPNFPEPFSFDAWHFVEFGFYENKDSDGMTFYVTVDGVIFEDSNFDALTSATSGNGRFFSVGGEITHDGNLFDSLDGYVGGLFITTEAENGQDLYNSMLGN